MYFVFCVWGFNSFLDGGNVILLFFILVGLLLIDFGVCLFNFMNIVLVLILMGLLLIFFDDNMLFLILVISMKVFLVRIFVCIMGKM